MQRTLERDERHLISVESRPRIPTDSFQTANESDRDPVSLRLTCVNADPPRERAVCNLSSPWILLRVGPSMAGWTKLLLHVALLSAWSASAAGFAQTPFGSLAIRLTDPYAKPLVGVVYPFMPGARATMAVQEAVRERESRQKRLNQTLEPAPRRDAETTLRPSPERRPTQATGSAAPA